MKKIYFSIPAILVAVTLITSGCSDYVGKEKSHPLFAKGAACADSQNYTDAVRAYEEFLAIAPKSARTHARLASLYFDHLDNPYRALYHYQKTAELSDANSPDVEDIEDFIKLCKSKMFEKLKEEYKADDRELEIMKNELQSMRTQLTSSENKIRQYVETDRLLREQNEAMKVRLRQLASERNAVNNTRRTATNTTATMPTTGTVTTGNSTSTTTASTTNTTNIARPTQSLDTYIVKTGDTLMKIARNVYGSASHYKHILNANKDQLGEDGNKLRVGQTLKLPPLPAPSGNTR